jgi:hypothetical protein
MISVFKFRDILIICSQKENYLLLRLKIISKDTLASGLDFIALCIQMFRHCCTHGCCTTSFGTNIACALLFGLTCVIWLTE